jgi:DNA-binding MarR family transcriptional regulator
MPDEPNGATAVDPGAAPPSVAFLVSRLGFEVGTRLAEGLAPLGIEPRHFGLLRALAINEGQSQRAIGEALDIHPNRMVALVDDLERLRLVQRRPHPTDRRAYALVLTPKGRRALQKAFEIAIDIENSLCADLTPDERSELLSLLGKLRPLYGGPPGVHPGLWGRQPSSRPAAGE